MEHKSLDEKAVKLSETYKRSGVDLISVLVSIKKNNSFLFLGFKNLWDYCIRQLGLSESQSEYLKHIIEVSVTVPGLASSALAQRELEREVAIENPRSAVRETLKPVSAVQNSAWNLEGFRRRLDSSLQVNRKIQRGNAGSRRKNT